jgi:hypothetical protein
MTKIRSTDGSNIQDRRGQGGGGGFSFPGLGRSGGGTGFPIPTKAGGGGLIGLLVIAAILILPRLLGGGDGSSYITPQAEQEGAETAECQTEIEQILCGAFNDAQEYWVRQYPTSFGGPYEVTEMVWFSGGTNTGCGQASSQTGPFYCPADHLVYFDIDFLEQLQSEFGAEGDLATAYIVAHEIGHHVQTINGTNDQVQQASGEELIDQNELSEALGAAAAVGDDRIQEQTTGRVNPEQWTHGSAEQRESWFRRGYETGDPAQCDTFAEI